jgi:hypothetical protein
LRFDVVGASASSHTGEFTDEFTAFNNISIRKGQAQTPTAGLDNRPALRFDVVGALSSSRTGEFTDEFTVVNNISIRKGQAQTPTAGLDNRPALRFDVVGALSGNGTEHSAGNINGFRLDIIPIRKGQAQTPTAGMDQRPALRFDVEGALSGVGSGQLSRIIAESAGNGFDASFVYTGKPQAHSAYAGSMPCGVAGARSEAEATFECCPQFADPLNYVNTLGNPITGKVGGAHTDASASYRTYATITHHDANYVSATDVVLIDIESDYFAELRSNLLRVCDDRLLPPSSTVIRDRSDVLDSTDRLALNICPDCFYSGNKISIYSRLPATPTRIPEDQPGLRTGVTVAGNSYGTMMFAVAAAPHRAIETGADCPS